MFSNMRLTPVGEGVARGVPTAKLCATGSQLGRKSQERPWGSLDPQSAPAGGGKNLPPCAAGGSAPADAAAIAPPRMAPPFLVKSSLCTSPQTFFAPLY